MTDPGCRHWHVRIYLTDKRCARFGFYAPDDQAADGVIEYVWRNGFVSVDGDVFAPGEIVDIHDPHEDP